MTDKEDQEIDDITDNALSFIKDYGSQAKDLCRQLRKILHNKHLKIRKKLKRKKK